MTYSEPQPRQTSDYAHENPAKLELIGLCFSYGSAAPIFSEYSWIAASGEAWAVLGPSGCGKTTFLYLLAGLRSPSAGHILVDGEPLCRPRPHTGLILQDYGLLPWASVRQNARLGLQIRTFYGPDGKHTPEEYTPEVDVDPWLERLGLMDVAEKYPPQISGGQRQRTAIARTLALKPDLLLMDEPFSSLDAPTREGLQQLTLDLQQEQALTLVIVTHAIEEAAVLGQKILLLSHPPNRQAIVLDNPHAADASYRNSPGYLELCKELRARLQPVSL